MIIQLTDNDKTISFTEQESAYIMECFDEIGGMFMSAEEQNIHSAIVDKLESLTSL